MKFKLPYKWELIILLWLTFFFNQADRQVFNVVLPFIQADLGLTYAEFEVLTVLSRAGKPYRLRPSELTRSAFLTSGGTSNVLQRLQKAGYVEREANTGDARSRFVQLTPEGLRVTTLALDASARAHREAMAGVPAEAVRDAADALRDVLLVIGKRRFR